MEKVSPPLFYDLDKGEVETMFVKLRKKTFNRFK